MGNDVRRNTMVGQARKGYEPVKKFRRGNIYILSRPGILEDKFYWVVVFDKKEKAKRTRIVTRNSYKSGTVKAKVRELETYTEWVWRFHILAQECMDLRMYPDRKPISVKRALTKKTLDGWCVREILEDDLAIYVGSNRIYAPFRKVLSGENLRVKRKNKIKRKFKPLMRGA